MSGNISWNIIRQADGIDRERLEAAAVRFARRHNLSLIDGDTMWDTLGWVVYDDPYLRKLWTACVRRALRDRRATGIAWGAVGYPTRY